MISHLQCRFPCVLEIYFKNVFNIYPMESNMLCLSIASSQRLINTNILVRKGSMIIYTK